MKPSYGVEEFIWLDGGKENDPTQNLRSKSRTFSIENRDSSKVCPSVPLTGKGEMPEDWDYDGSSTNQSPGDCADLTLKPVMVIKDPTEKRVDKNLVLCSVFEQSGHPHSTNKRSDLMNILSDLDGSVDPWVGFEQEYTLLKSGRPLGFPTDGFPGPQGPYYCGVGAEKAYGRSIVEEHYYACLEAGISIYGTNAEVMSGQWEYQVGPIAGGDVPNIINMCDQLWLSRFLLCKVAESHGVEVSFSVKPVLGDWNGSGMHSNFSTADMRRKGGLDLIMSCIPKLRASHSAHVKVYGHNLSARLTGLHETCDIGEFKVGNSDRGASIRIPNKVGKQGYGYFEDRRPGANADPYEIARSLINTVCF